MKLVNSDMIVMFDVDDTILMWNNVDYRWPGEDKVELQDPYDKSIVYLKPHNQNINLMKKYKTQGYTVIVWSAGGYLWAEEAVNKLKINNLVDLVMSKPLKYVDDLKASEILGTRVYIPFDQVNKMIEPGEQE